MNLRKVLRLISLIMFIISILVILLAFGNPQIGMPNRLLWFNVPFQIKSAIVWGWRIVMILSFILSFFVKNLNNKN